VSNEKKEIKVTDKRMFTPDGKLKEEYRFLDEKSTSDAEPEPPPPSPPPARADREPEPRASSRRAPGPDFATDFEPDLQPDFQPKPGYGPEPAARVDFPNAPPDLGGPSFYDLVAMMAEPVPIYLGDALLPDGQDASNLEMARLHIDLLDVLRQKTAGNLTAQERAFLEDLLYRLRVRYVQKRG
jgi:hypothetical protein